MFFESFGNFFSNVNHFFHDGYNKIADGVHSVYEKVTGTTSLVAGTVYTDVKKFVSGAGNLVEHTIDSSKSIVTDVVHSAKDVIENGQKVIGTTISNTASSLSMPLVIGAGLFGYFMLTKK